MKLSSLIMSVLLSLLLGLGAFFYLHDGYPSKIYFYIFAALLIALVAVYVLQAELDWRWSLRKPPKMPAPLERQLAVQLPYYRRLAPMERQRFRDRCMLWDQSREYHKEGLEEIPEEMRNLMAGLGVMMTFGIEKYLLLPYDRVVLYPHPFPSPEHNFLHHSETHDGDGVMILNINPLLSSIHKPREYYNIALHEYAGMFIRLHPETRFPELRAEEWQRLAQLRGFDRQRACKCVGFPEIDDRQLLAEHFFTIPAAFQKHLPEAYAQMCQAFNQDPMRPQKPVLDIRKVGENPLAGE